MRNVGPMCALVLVAACGGGGAFPDAPPPPERDISMGWPEPLFAGCGAPEVDGTLSPGEWEGAIPIHFARWSESGQAPMYWQPTVVGEVMAMSDDQNLYVALRVRVDASASVHLRSVLATLEDDELSFSWEEGANGPAAFEDGFLWDCHMGPQYSPSTCSTPDVDGWKARVSTGTTDGGGALQHGEAETTIELWHPYTGEDPRDLLRAAGQTLFMSLDFTLVGPCRGYEDYYPCTYRYEQTRELLLGACTAPPPELQMIEVRFGAAGESLPFIDFTSSESSVPVALIGSATFLVASVDPSKLYMDAAPLEAPGLGGDVVDVNGDGIDDLVVRFRKDEMGTSPSNPYNYARTNRDDELTVAGRTTEGQTFYGMSGVRLIYDP